VSDEEIEAKAQEYAKFIGFDGKPNYAIKIEVNCIRMGKWMRDRINGVAK
jgi:hypothetical protein